MPDDYDYPDAHSVLKFKDWLRTALDAYHRAGLVRRAFRPFGAYLERHEDLAWDLYAAYRSRPAQEAGRWRQAVRDLLAEHGATPAFDAAARTLIDLATLMPAPDVLDVLPGMLRGRVGDGANRMANRVVAAAESLASRTEASLACLEAIRTSPSFASHHAGLVLTALCRVDPDGWVDHVVNLEPAMQELGARLAGDREALRQYADRILVAITLSRVTPRARKRLLVQLLARHGIYSNWLYGAWLVGDASLLVQSGDELWLRANPAIRVRFEDEPLEEDFLVQASRAEFDRFAECLAAMNLRPATAAVAMNMGSSLCSTLTV